MRLVGYAVADEVVPGEERTVTVACDPRAFRLWDEAASGGITPSWRHIPHRSRSRWPPARTILLGI